MLPQFNFTSHKGVVVFLIIMTFFSRCKKDDPAPVDSTGPTLSFVDLADEASVWNAVSLALNATDASGVERVEIYIDGALVSTLTQPPFQFQWNSNTTTDGAHTIRGVAYDKSANKTESQVRVNVKNILVSIDVAGDYISSNSVTMDRAFVFLSDENGKLIASSELHNGDKIQLKNVDYKSEIFFLTETFFEGQRKTLRTFAAVDRGKNWVLTNYPHTKDLPYVGAAVIDFTSPKLNGGYLVASNGQAQYLHDTNLILNLLRNPSKLYVERYDETSIEPTQYALYPRVVLGSNSISLASVTNNISNINISIPDDINRLTLYLYGVDAVAGGDDFYYLRSLSYRKGDTQSRPLYYPGTAFSRYYSYFTFDTDKRYYEKTSFTDFFKIDEIKNNLTFNFSNNTLHYTASGDFDFFSIPFVENYNEWYFLLPKGTGTVPSLQLPDALTTSELPVIAFPQGYDVMDYQSMNGYEDLKAFVRTSARGLFNLLDDGVIYTTISYKELPTGGRPKPYTPFIKSLRRGQ